MTLDTHQLKCLKDAKNLVDIALAKLKAIESDCASLPDRAQRYFSDVIIALKTAQFRFQGE
jgi:hypothetical protein